LEYLFQIFSLTFSSGENVEEAFVETAKHIFEKIQNGRYLGASPPFIFCSFLFSSILERSETLFFLAQFLSFFLFHHSLDLNAAESGVQQKTVPVSNKATAQEGCAC